MADQRRLQRALDHVVFEKRNAPALRLIEDVEHIFTIRRTDAASVTHAIHVLLKRTVFAVLQVIATRKKDAVIIGQLYASRTNRIHTQHLLRQGIEDQIAPLLFTVRQYFEQDQTTNLRIFKHSIIKRLVRFLHRFTVNSKAVISIVFDLDRERAANGFDKHFVENIDVRETPLHQLIAACALPVKVKRRRQFDIAFAAIIYVANLFAIGRYGPAKHTHIGNAITNLKACQQLVIAHCQLHEFGVFVIGIELLKVLHKALNTEKTFLQINRRDLVALFTFMQAVQSKNIFDTCGLLEA